jgi:hypothetical protein
MSPMKQFKHYLDQYHPAEATQETHGWQGWYVENGKRDQRIFLNDKTHQEAVRVATLLNQAGLDPNQLDSAGGFE